MISAEHERPEDSHGYDAEAVAKLSELPVPPGSKGFSGRSGAGPVTGASLAAAGTGLFSSSFSFPLLALRDSALAHNIDQLARFVAGAGLQLAPHAKTTMAPQIFARQLAAGAWGLTAASMDQVLVYRRFGVRRVLLANELVDPGAIGRLAQELRDDPDFEVCCYVDSLAGVELLAAGLADGAPGRRLNVLVELGYPGGRTGCRTVPEARSVAAAAAATSTLAVIGVAGYEGGLGHHRTPEAVAAVSTWCRQLLQLHELLRADGSLVGPGLVTAGGSAFPDVVAAAFADRPAGVLGLLRSGSYVTHDEGMYADITPFGLQPALQLWARVLSRPEPGLALLGLGRRDVGFDQGMPIPNRIRTRAGEVSSGAALRVTELNDQHAYVDVPVEHPLEPGDLVGLGISHPCTTMDRWRQLILIDDDERVLDVVSTYF